MRRLIFAVCLTGAPLLAIGQSMIYKVQMPDGSVLYSDSVPSGGKVLEEREAKSTPRVTRFRVRHREGRPAGHGQAVRRSAVARALPPKGPTPPTNSRLGTRTGGRKEKLELGREPLPGERRGLAGGGSRLTPEYEARIAGMEREVAATEAKLKSAYDKR